jgi:hypothetical protein
MREWIHDFTWRLCMLRMSINILCISEHNRIRLLVHAAQTG